MKYFLLKFQRIKLYTFYEILRYVYDRLYIKIYRILNHDEYGDLLNKAESDDGNYVSFVKKTLINKYHFKNFKRNPIYRIHLEHVTYRMGLDYLSEIHNINSKILDNIDKFIVNDKTGNPIRFYYKSLNKKISPTTLRYLKVASDIENYFGNKFDNIVEIGCGYGGQYIVLDKIFEIQNYTFFDLDDVNSLIKKNLEQFNVMSKYYFGNDTKKIDKIDLLISNYAFSELPKNLQIKYLEEVISKSAHGYMTMNSGLDFNNFLSKKYDETMHDEFKNHLSYSDIKKFIPNCRVVEEKPLTGNGNYIIIW